MNLNNTVLFTGAGFSSAYGIPTTNEITNHFLDLPPTEATPEPIQQEISKQLRQYWAEIFGYANGSYRPSFEEHFTILDLSANSGHNLGRVYSPQKLRAIRRLSIHRVFDILDTRFVYNQKVYSFLRELAQSNNSSILTTNWDIGVEKHLDSERIGFNYGLEIHPVNQYGNSLQTNGIKILKLHGSSNWAYCDTCRRLYYYDPNIGGKGALHSWAFLESNDFRNLPKRNAEVAKMVGQKNSIKCEYCKNKLTARIATFSYEKLLGFNPFQQIWNQALSVLRNADRWIFIGYSLPEADYELRHLLKVAQLGSNSNNNIEIIIVLGSGNGSTERYHQFFGNKVGNILTGGFENWYTQNAS